MTQRMAKEDERQGKVQQKAGECEEEEARMIKGEGEEEQDNEEDKEEDIFALSSVSYVCLLFHLTCIQPIELCPQSMS